MIERIEKEKTEREKGSTWIKLRHQAPDEMGTKNLHLAEFLRIPGKQNEESTGYHRSTIS